MNIWVNGCFDILHSGHLDLLQFAKYYKNSNYYKKGEKNKLIVGIDSDRRVRKLKGKARPIISEKERKKILESLRYVDKVVIFDSSDELRNNIKRWHIDFMIVGDVYRNRKVIGSEKSKYGVIYYPVDTRSTSNIIDKILELYDSSNRR
jgi:D-beta-D-heptose 7-phosphate kinase/D-beta-D-heptose 1-phosphate adenosyltransferase